MAAHLESTESNLKFIYGFNKNKIDLSERTRSYTNIGLGNPRITTKELPALGSDKTPIDKKNKMEAGIKNVKLLTDIPIKKNSNNLVFRLLLEFIQRSNVKNYKDEFW